MSEKPVAELSPHRKPVASDFDGNVSRFKVFVRRGNVFFASDGWDTAEGAQNSVERIRTMGNEFK
jgi:hypothetical protein